jgi:hypothetical protein
MSITIALGKKGSGKSALLRKICSHALGQKAALFFHDPLAQISPAGGRIYTSAHQWARDPRPLHLSIFRDVDTETVARLALSVGDVTLVLDEMDEGFRDKRYASPDSALRRIIHYGRHHRVCLLGAFRRTPNVSEDLVSQCDRAFLFHTPSSCPHDLITIRQRFGEGVADAVQRLDFGQCLMWSDDGKDPPASLQSAVGAIVGELPKRRGPAGAEPPRPPRGASAPPPPRTSWLPEFFS